MAEASKRERDGAPMAPPTPADVNDIAHYERAAAAANALRSHARDYFGVWGDELERMLWDLLNECNKQCSFRIAERARAQLEAEAIAAKSLKDAPNATPQVLIDGPATEAFAAVPLPRAAESGEVGADGMPRHVPGSVSGTIKVCFTCGSRNVAATCAYCVQRAWARRVKTLNRSRYGPRRRSRTRRRTRTS
jgi:hypothetical protein